jgi:hypothetical protein
MIDCSTTIEKTANKAQALGQKVGRAGERCASRELRTRAEADIPTHKLKVQGFSFVFFQSSFNPNNGDTATHKDKTSTS